MNPNLKRFFEDPEWKTVEETILSFIEPLIDMSTIDLNQPAEHIKAEVIGRQKLYKQMTDFLEQTGIINKRGADKPTTFR